MLEEVWRSLDCIGYGCYSVSSYGNVRNDISGRLMKLQNHEGYMCVSLKRDDDGLQHHLRVHRLVASAFIPNPDNLPEVNHIDECRDNNFVGNLEWCDGRYNIEYSGINRPVLRWSLGGDVICEYWSVGECARANKISETSLRKHLNGLCKKRLCKGMLFSYKGEEPFYFKVNVVCVRVKAKPIKVRVTAEDRKDYDRLKYILNREEIKAKSRKWKSENQDKVIACRERYKEKRHEIDVERYREKKLRNFNI